jgi:hypothetical protein
MIILKRQILLIVLTVLLSLQGSLVHSEDITLNLEYPNFGGFDPNSDQDLNELVAWAYYFITTIAGFAAFYMLVQGGLLWLSSGGDPAKISEARDKIQSALLGLLIILSSFLILEVINPELTTLEVPELKAVPIIR